MPGFTRDVIEIDLNRRLRHEKLPVDDELYIHVPAPHRRSYSFMLRDTPTSFGGVRKWFICPICKQNKMKLFTFRDVVKPGRIGCRTCLGLKYDSQFGEQTLEAKRERVQKAMELIEDQHILWYGSRRTRFGFRHFELQEKSQRLETQITSKLLRQLCKFQLARMN